MARSVRVAFAACCLVVGAALSVASFTAHHDTIAWYTSPGLLLLIIGGVLLRQWRRRPSSAPSETSAWQRRFLLVLLRRSPTGLNAQVLEAAARSAWGGRFGPNRDGSDYVESGGEGLGFVLQAHGNAFLVLETQRGVRNFEIPRRAHPESALGLWPEYSHELSVGLAYNYDTDAGRLCAFVGSLCAALADGETLGLLHPGSGELWQFDRSTAARLSADPEAFFGPEQVE